MMLLAKLISGGSRTRETHSLQPGLVLPGWGWHGSSKCWLRTWFRETFSRPMQEVGEHATEVHNEVSLSLHHDRHINNSTVTFSFVCSRAGHFILFTPPFLLKPHLPHYICLSKTHDWFPVTATVLKLGASQGSFSTVSGQQLIRAEGRNRHIRFLNSPSKEGEGKSTGCHIPLEIITTNHWPHCSDTATVYTVQSHLGKEKSHPHTCQNLVHLESVQDKGEKIILIREPGLWHKEGISHSNNMFHWLEGHRPYSSVLKIPFIHAKKHLPSQGWGKGLLWMLERHLGKRTGGLWSQMCQAETSF